MDVLKVKLMLQIYLLHAVTILGISRGNPDHNPHRPGCAWPQKSLTWRYVDIPLIDCCSISLFPL